MHFEIRGGLRFSQEDIDYLNGRGLTTDAVETQISILKGAYRHAVLDRPATEGDGIICLNAHEKFELARFYERQISKYGAMRFVPASGMATRMFHDIWEFYKSGHENSISQKFFANIRKFIFFYDLEKYVNYGNDKRVFTKFLLTETGLNYGNLPKALLKFYKVSIESFTPLDMHLLAAMDYAWDRNHKLNIHFTVQPDFEKEIRKVIHARSVQIEDKYGIGTTLCISYQKPATQTVSVDEMGKLVRVQETNEIWLRAGGHGSLIDNLIMTDAAELIFIRNIDNVMPPGHNTLNVFYEKIMGGYLIKIRERLFSLLRRLELGDMTAYDESILFAEMHLNAFIPVQLKVEKNINALYGLLNRPVRVCGMIKKQGEPGGGPFWVRDRKGNISLQIIEQSQVNRKDEMQEKVLESARYFNPVDMVCSIIDHNGKTYSLREFTDDNACIVSERVFSGKKVTVLEHPGLWNGCMALWHTLLIEIPAECFNPVKTVLDLLRISAR